jgi:hypothetical protein
MKTQLITAAALAAVVSTFALAATESNPIKDAMDFAHKAPKGEKKISEKIVDGTVSDADLKKTLDLYKAMADTKPPKGDQADFKDRVTKLVAATEEVVEKKPEAAAHYKEAVNCKTCHTEHKSDPPKP